MESINLALNLDVIKSNYPENPLEFFRGKRLCLFKACLETYFPGVRWGIQDLLEDLDLEVNTCPNQSCCSGTFFQRNLITRAQFAAINERNINEMNQLADIVLFSCNGCYNSLLRGREFLKIPEVKKKTDEILNSLKQKGLKTNYPNKYEILDNFNLKLVHDLDFLYLIRNEVVNALKFDLKDLKVAIHYGCKFYKSENEKFVSYFDDIVKTLGVETVSYEIERACCGYPLTLHSFDVGVEDRTKWKLDKIKEANVDGIAIVCSECFEQFEKSQFLLRRKGERYNIPMIHLIELIALALGFSPKEIGLNRHRIRCDAVVKKIGLEGD